MRSSAVFVGLVRGRPVTSFLVWFFTVGQLIAFVPLLGAANGVRLAPEPFTIASTLVGLLLPALVITWMVDGPSAVRELLRRATAARLSPWWYAVVLGLVPLTSLGIACATAGPPEDTTASRLAVAYLLGLVLQTVVHLVTNNLWEEVAWTGFVQARLQSRTSAITAAALTGPMFALQHTALVVGGSVVGTIAVLLALTVLAVPYRAVMGWLYNRTHSLLLVGAAHAAGDAVAAGTVLGHGFLPRLYGQNLGPLHLFAFAAIGLAVVLATRGRLGRTTPSPGSSPGPEPRESQPAPLARAGVDVMVLEQYPDFFRSFRGDAIHASTFAGARRVDQWCFRLRGGCAHGRSWPALQPRAPRHTPVHHPRPERARRGKVSVMRRVILPPAVVVVVAAVAIGVAFVLDTGGSGQRDAALLIGTAGLWVLAVGTLWLIAAQGHLAYQRRRPPRF